ncbi:MAG: SLBB domain-containing protein, partial [Propionibacteriales bacterium]|nr:SLBB domain-containing protein [Propionibacteriales bacterium]
MREPVQHQLSEQLRARLARALGDQATVVPQRAAETPLPRRHAVDESLIRTVLRDPDPVEDASGFDIGDDRSSGPGQVFEASGVVSRSLERLAFTRRHLIIVVVIATLAVGLAGYFLLQARAVPLDGAGVPEVSVGQQSAPSAPSAPSASDPASEPSAVVSASVSQPALIKVHVLGAVGRPQVVQVPEGARVGDVIEAAGGLTRSAVLGQLNLAQPIRDGQQVYVSASKKKPSEVRDPGAAPGVTTSSNPGPGGASVSGGAQLNLNTATVAELEALPGIGPVTAQ